MRKNLIGLLFAGVILLCPMLVAKDTSDFNVAYVDLDKVFSSQLINSKLNALKEQFKGRQEDFEAAKSRFQEMQEEFEKESATMTKIVRENRDLELKEMAARLSQQGAEMSNEFFMQQKQIQSNYMGQIADISKFLAKKYDVQVVFAKQGLLYISEDLDLTEELLRELK